MTSGNFLLLTLYCDFAWGCSLENFSCKTAFTKRWSYPSLLTSCLFTKAWKEIALPQNLVSSKYISSSPDSGMAVNIQTLQPFEFCKTQLVIRITVNSSQMTISLKNKDQKSPLLWNELFKMNVSVSEANPGWMLAFWELYKSYCILKFCRGWKIIILFSYLLDSFSWANQINRVK